jgi:hypothetical protein
MVKMKALCTCFLSVVWQGLSGTILVISWNYISVASKWLSEEKSYTTNIISSAVMRGLWLTRNDFVFNNQVWSDVKMELKRIWKLSIE